MTMKIQDVTPHYARGPAPDVPLVIYGNRWCGLTQQIRRALDHAGIGYDDVDLDVYPEIERRLSMLAGAGLRTPVVYVGGDWLMEPTLWQVQAALARHGALVRR